jgi:hypothetical protein
MLCKERTERKTYEPDIVRNFSKANGGYYDAKGPRICGVNRRNTTQELAEAGALSVNTIRQIFRDEPGVLQIGKPRTRTKRGYCTLRIPEEVAQRVHRRLSA